MDRWNCKVNWSYMSDSNRFGYTALFEESVTRQKSLIRFRRRNDTQ